jgi:DivIVA domain-containing protein
MAASVSRPDPASPASVAEAGFSTARRGYQPDEVRAFLVAVAAEMGRLHERERQLEAELRAAKAAVSSSSTLDEATATELLGEETIRVLQTARESASQIKIRAEENAARILREAGDEANRLRQEAEVDTARRRQDASADAEAEVALAKQQGREMVNEARAYRERVLADLDRRTTLARQQIEELIHGRDRLLQVFERARLVAVDVTSELRDIDTPDELVNLTPTTGPVPIMVPAPRPERRVEPEPVAEQAPAVSEEAPVVQDEPVQDEPVAGVGESEAMDDGAVEEAVETVETVEDIVDVEDTVDVVEVPVEETEAAADAPIDVAVDVAVDVDVAVEESAVDDGTVERNDDNVVSLFRGRTAPVYADDDHDDDADDADDGAADDADHGADDDEVGEADHDDEQQVPVDQPSDAVGGLFARLRDELPSSDSVVLPPVLSGAGVEHDDEESETDAGGPATPVESAFTRRDEALVPLIVGAARKIKRVLADEQNLVLDSLRQREPVIELDQVVPDTDGHVATYLEAVAADLLDAAVAGAIEAGSSDTKKLRTSLTKSGSLDAATTVLRSMLVSPLRERLARSIADGAGDNEAIAKRMRAVYREWKTQQIDGQLDDVFLAAHGSGLVAGVEPGTPLTWVVAPTDTACPDCEDNSLSGAVAAGQAFPTGATCAPAHPGCHCMTLP